LFLLILKQFGYLFISVFALLIKYKFLFQESIAWGFPKNSPYLALMNFELNSIKESGLLKKLFQKQVYNFCLLKTQQYLFLMKRHRSDALQFKQNTYIYSWSQKHYSLVKKCLYSNPFHMKISLLHF
jgi:hypothetical protein